MTLSDSSSFELQALLDATVDAVILIDAGGVMEVFNHSAERMFGYTAAEAIGQNVRMLMTGRDRVHHDAYLGRYVKTGVAHIIGTGRDVLGRRKDGHEFPAFLSVGRIADSDPPRFVGFIQDTTVRQQALAAVQRERDRANRYLEAAQTILVAFDLAHRVTLINRTGSEVLGYDEDSLKGHDWIDTVVAAAERPSTILQLDRLAERGPRQPLHCEYSVVTRGGASRLIAWRCVVIEDPAGDATGFLCSGDDVTESRQAELEARESRERMMHVSRLATMGEMATGISHELNQPLAAIANYAQAGMRLMKQPQPDVADVTEALAQIAGQALRAGEIIRRLRELVKNKVTQRERASINEVIEELGPIARADARINDVRIVLDLTPGLPAVSVDRIQIQQVLLNLLRNSIDALGAVAAQHRSIVIRSAATDAGDVTVTVTDNGPGIDPAVLDRLFMPFVTSKADGTGLGLAISRTIAESHKGRLDYVAPPERGASFVLTLPSDPGTIQ
jgi:two-component system, LuxR family, sensor kinase FixL